MRSIDSSLRIILAVALIAFIVPPELGAQTFVAGSSEQLIKEIRDAMPPPGSNGFVVPTNAEMNIWANVFVSMRGHDYGTVTQLVSPYGYDCLRYLDTLWAETLYVLKESLPVQRGWGTYIFNEHARNQIAIEVPHPRYDTNTCVMGIRTFLKLNAEWFMLAGTHRYANPDSSSDMAHVTQSIFHDAHTTIAEQSAIQIHGFNRSNPIYTGYPEIVISNGTTSPPPILTTLESRYEVYGFTAGVFSSSTYSQLWRLGATQNKQGQWSNAHGKAFVHLEHDFPIRVDSARMTAAIQALHETFASTNAVADPTPLPAVITLDQNYPNPFNPVTRFEMRISKRVHVSLKIYDSLGREVATLVDGVKTPGIYSIPWDASGEASGMYFALLRSGAFTASKKITLIR